MVFVKGHLYGKRFKKGSIPWNKGKSGLQKNHNIEGLKLGQGWNKGLKIKTKCAICNKEMNKWSYSGVKKTCSKKCRNELIRQKRKLQEITFETRIKMSESARKIVKERIKKGTWFEPKKGEDNPMWKGGISFENKTLRQSPEYRKWRKDVFRRDYWTCKFCGYKGQNIEADHIKGWADYPKLRFDVDNGRTLCKNCHKRITFKEDNVYPIYV